MKRQRYFSNWDSHDDLCASFRIDPLAVKDKEILFAWYGDGDYSGAARVLFQRKGKLYEVEASRCSCYGVEGQWEPQEVTWEQLAMRGLNPFNGYDDPKEQAKVAWFTLINTHVPRA